MEILGIIAAAALSGTGGGGRGYVAKAVHFDGTQSISIASLTSVDNQSISFVGWFRIASYSDVTPYYAWCSGNDTDHAATTLNLGGAGNSLEMAWATAAGVGNSWYTVEANPLPLDQWVCFIGSAKSSAPSTGDFYFNNDDVTAVFVDPGHEPFTIETNGLPAIFGTDVFGQPYIGDAADWRFLPGVSLLDGSGEIPLATRRLFIDENGKPVDPAVATAALGVAGAVLFSGDADTFVTNQGTGGAFTLTGTLTNATTSPSD